jgi:transposase
VRTRRLAIGHLPTKGLGSVTPWSYLRTTPSTRSSENIPSETAWEIERGRSMTYAPEHRKMLFDRPHRHRRGVHRKTEDPRHPREPRRDLLLRSQKRLPLAASTEGFPLRETVYWWFGRWRVDGTFERVNAALRELLRARLGRAPLPRAGIADSHSAKTTGVGGEERGIE